MAKRRSIQIVLTGDDRINRALVQMRDKDAKNAIRKSSRTVLKWLLPSVRAVTPVGSVFQRGRPYLNAKYLERSPGLLRDSLKVKAVARSRSRVGAMISTNAGHLFTGETFYGGFQEWGWKSRGGRKIPGKYFIKRTTDRRRQAALTRYRIELRKHIEADLEQYL